MKIKRKDLKKIILESLPPWIIDQLKRKEEERRRRKRIPLRIPTPQPPEEDERWKEEEEEDEKRGIEIIDYSIDESYIRRMIRNYLLTEGRIENRFEQARDSKKLKDRAAWVVDFEARLLSNPDTPQSLKNIGYVNWGLKQIERAAPVELPTIAREIMSLLSGYDELKVHGLNADIFMYKTMGELRGAIEDLRPKVAQKKSETEAVSAEYRKEALKKDENLNKAKLQSDILYDKGHIMMIHPRSTYASKFWGNPQKFGWGNEFGSPVRWCTSATSSENYFCEYASGSNIFLFYIIDKSKPTTDPMNKIAYAISGEPPGIEDDEYWDGDDTEIFNANDDSIGEFRVEQAIGRKQLVILKEKMNDYIAANLKTKIRKDTEKIKDPASSLADIRKIQKENPELSDKASIAIIRHPDTPEDERKKSIDVILDTSPMHNSEAKGIIYDLIVGKSEGEGDIQPAPLSDHEILLKIAKSPYGPYAQRYGMNISRALLSSPHTSDEIYREVLKSILKDIRGEFSPHVVGQNQRMNLATLLGDPRGSEFGAGHGIKNPIDPLRFPSDILIDIVENQFKKIFHGGQGKQNLARIIAGEAPHKDVLLHIVKRIMDQSSDFGPTGEKKTRARQLLVGDVIRNENAGSEVLNHIALNPDLPPERGNDMGPLSHVAHMQIAENPSVSNDILKFYLSELGDPDRFKTSRNKGQHFQPAARKFQGSDKEFFDLYKNAMSIARNPEGELKKNRGWTKEKSSDYLDNDPYYIEGRTAEAILSGLLRNPNTPPDILADILMTPGMHELWALGPYVRVNEVNFNRVPPAAIIAIVELMKQRSARAGYMNMITRTLDSPSHSGVKNRRHYALRHSQEPGRRIRKKIDAYKKIFFDRLSLKTGGLPPGHPDSRISDKEGSLTESIDIYRWKLLAGIK